LLSSTNAFTTAKSLSRLEGRKSTPIPNMSAFVEGPAAMITRRFQRKPCALVDPLATCPLTGRGPISTWVRPTWRRRAGPAPIRIWNRRWPRSSEATACPASWMTTMVGQKRRNQTGSNNRDR
jgi:hypothetical protein